jgi:hypothetical protein
MVVHPDRLGNRQTLLEIHREFFRTARKSRRFEKAGVLRAKRRGKSGRRIYPFSGGFEKVSREIKQGSGV